MLYKSLQAGRVVAAMLVILYHLGLVIAAEKYFGITGFSIPCSIGSAGIEFFFILSGVIIFTAHRNDIFKPERLISYLRKRITRICPTYWLISIIVFLWAIIVPSLRNSVPHDLIVILKSLLLIPQNKGVVGEAGSPIIIIFCVFSSILFHSWVEKPINIFSRNRFS